MVVYLNRAPRPLHSVRVRAFHFDLPDAYDQNASYIGTGTYGTVVRTKGTTSRMNGSVRTIEVAIKKFRGSTEKQEVQRRMAQLCYRELKLLQHLDHPNIVRILDVYTPARNAHELEENIYLVLEYAGSTLDKILTESKMANHVYLPMERIPTIIRDTLRALKYLKAADVLHRDLSASNIAIHTSGKAVLIDFGFARTGKVDKSSELTGEVGTPYYSAPEVTFWKGGSYGREADIWSLGCILAELISWVPLFKDHRSKISVSVSLFGPISAEFSAKVDDKTAKTYIEGLNAKRIAAEEKRKAVERQMEYAELKEYFIKTNKKVADLSDPRHEAVLDFLRKCLQCGPEARISIEDALRHRFLADIFVNEDFSGVQPLVYDDSERSIEDWKCVLFHQIHNFRAREDTPRP